MNGCRNCIASIVVFLLLTFPLYAQATWSIVAVDPETGEVGIAVAICNPGAQFIAAVVPGFRMVAAQAETSHVGETCQTIDSKRCGRRAGSFTA
ncbi:MAG: hypothetical protein ACI9FR_002633 [Cryomorphaceae bacterium]|jgi:hypothetical protein